MSPRYDLPRTRAVPLLLVAMFALAAPAAQADSSGACSHAGSAVANAAAAPAAVPSRLSVPVWMPEWLTPGLASDVTDYAALYRAPSTPIAPGLLIAIDPETGMPMRPTAEQIRALTVGMESSNALIEPMAPMQTELLPGGGVAVHLNGHFQMFSIVRIGPDGKPVMDCSVDAATARRLLVAPLVAPGAPTKE